MLDLRLYMLQRLSALILAPLVLTHIGVMIYAVQGGLSAAEILGRTQGSIPWMLFYGLFVAAVSVHAAIGVARDRRGVVWRSRHASERPDLAVFAVLGILGARAVYAVTAL